MLNASSYSNSSERYACIGTIADDPGEIVLDEGTKEERASVEGSSCREEIGHFRYMRPMCVGKKVL